MEWACERLAEMQPLMLYEALALRSAVFVVEQACVYLDPDGLDAQCWHLTGRSDDMLRAYARLVPPQTKGAQQTQPMIGRVVTAPAARGHGQGRALMLQALAECARRWPGEAVEIQAQAYLHDFYAGLGFVASSRTYDEDGIPHIDMQRHAP
ncbi:GNAT family N-acetyltransferase [soil metagenome]